MSERDPRIDPRVGDVLRKGLKTRTICGVGFRAGWHLAVWGTECIVHQQPFNCYTQAGWLRWSKNATVVSQSEDSNA